MGRAKRRGFALVLANEGRAFLRPQTARPPEGIDLGLLCAGLTTRRFWRCADGHHRTEAPWFRNRLRTGIPAFRIFRRFDGGAPRGFPKRPSEQANLGPDRLARGIRLDLSA